MDFIFHFYIFFKKHLFYKLKNIYFGTNSKNFFLLQNKSKFFLSIINKFYFFIKIIQNKKPFLTKIFFYYKNLLLYKKINGVIFFFLKTNISLKLSYVISNFKFKNIKKNVLLKLFFFKNKNFLKFFFKKKIKSNMFSHNDIFKDNVLVNGNFITSLIDFNNFSFFKNNNDISNINLEFTENFFFIKNIIIENFFKNKFFLINIYFYIIKIIISRKIKKMNKKKLNLIKIILKNFF